MASRCIIALLLLIFAAPVPAQEVTAYRHLNVTLATSAPGQLAIDRGRLIWRDTDINTGKLNLKYFSGGEIVALDSLLDGVTAAISGDDVVWSTTGGAASAFDQRTWTVIPLGTSYNPDGLQPVAVHNGMAAFARRTGGTGTAIVLRRLGAGTDTLFTAGVWNTAPSVHHGQIAWVAADTEPFTASSNIYFFNGRSTGNLSGTTGVVNRSPLVRDGQVAWVQTGGGPPRVLLYTGDTTLTLAQSPGGAVVVTGYDLSGGIAAAALKDTVTSHATISVYVAETRALTTLSDSNGVTSLHVSNGLLAWQSGTGPGKRLLLSSLQGAATQDLGIAENPVLDHDLLAWTLGDAVEMARPVTYRQLTTDGLNGWEQTKFKTIDSARVVWGNFANSLNMRLATWDGNQTALLTDSLVTRDLVMANDGYVIWRSNFDSLYLYDGVHAPVKFLDTIQAENPYVANGSIGFFGTRTGGTDPVRHPWLYDIASRKLTLLPTDSAATSSVMCSGPTACWLDAKTGRLMFYNGATAAALSDSMVLDKYSYRNGIIVWSESRNGIYQVMVYDVVAHLRSQVTTGTTSNVNPVTDGAHVIWYEHPGYPAPSPDIRLWYYDRATGNRVCAGHAPYSNLAWNWMSDGKIAWSNGGNVFVFDGRVMTALTDDNFSVNSGAYLDRGMILWRRTPPPPQKDNGQIFTGKLHAHASFDAINVGGSAPLTVSFANRSWEGSGRSTWDFGDGTGSAAGSPVHTYLLPGRYTVSLTVEGPAGQSSERKYRLVRANPATSAGETAAEVPLSTALLQNYPNPFNPVTNIGVQLAAAGQVSLKVYDLLGREVATLVNGVQPAGHFTVQWNAGARASGVYYCVLKAGNYTGTRSLMLLK